MSKNIKLSESSLQVLKSRYFMEGENWETCTYRVAREIAQAEKNPTDWISKFQKSIYEMDFLPAGRILRNAGRARGSLFNCYHLPIGDSIEEIGQFLKDSLILWSDGGGVGCTFSSLRPKGDSIKGKGGESSGLVSFMKAANDVAKTIESGGARRAAALGAVDVSHPEVMDFIKSKMQDGELSGFNISVIINGEFLAAVESDDEWEFKFNHRSYGKVRAREIWNLIVTNMVNHAEPGLLNGDNLYKNNSYYYDPVTGTNPCLTGDTLIAVADGRNAVPIKQLAEEGKDVPVYCFDEINNKPKIKMMRNPRITGKNSKILKITLENGSIVKCTENHKFILRDGSIKEAKDLIVGTSLHHMTIFNGSFDEVLSDFWNSKSSDYSWITTSHTNPEPTHRLLAEYKLKRKLKNGEVVHHIDKNSLNNIEENIEVMSRDAHNKLHAIDMMGENNPMNRFPEKNWLIKQDHSGINNGNYKGYTPVVMLNKAIDFINSMKRSITVDEWKEYCIKNDYPYDSRYIWNGHKSLRSWLDEATHKSKYSYLNPKQLIEYKRYLILKDEYDLNLIFENGSIFVEKICETCNETFKIKWDLREAAYCSRKCASNSQIKNVNLKRSLQCKQKDTRDKQLLCYIKLKNELNREPLLLELKEECKINNISLRFRGEITNTENPYIFKTYKELKESANSFNFKVASIEFDGYEDVYNGTVDLHHNLYIQVSVTQTDSKKPQYNHILTRQCGEAVLAPYDVCDLGSLVLPNFITGSVNTNWKKLYNTIKIGVRFLDNVIDVNKFSLKETEIKAQNSRRIGLGVMGLAEYLFAKEVRYGSQKALNEVEKLMRFIRDATYETLVELASEKGSFPKFDPVAYGKAHFIRTLPASLRMDIKKYGSRCVTGLALAPTGTISLIPEVTSGIEPLYSKAYWRNDRISRRPYIHPLLEKLVTDYNGDIPEWFVDSYDLKPEDHFEIQAMCQKYIDGAVSKTINMPKGTTPEQLSNLLLEYINDLKGTTVYVDGSKGEQIYQRMSDDEVYDVLKNKNEIKDTNPGIESVKCATGTCEI